MAGKLPLRLTNMASQRSISCLAASRSITTTTTTLRSRPSLLISKQAALLPRPTFQQSFRRSFADQAPKVELSPQPKPKKRFRIFRFIWRVTYLSTAAFFGWIGYSIWQLRNPPEQFEPDPNKKTLVVLGVYTLDLAQGLPSLHDHHVLMNSLSQVLAGALSLS